MSSGSRCSEMEVNETRSRNRTETSRRSVERGGWSWASGAATVATAEPRAVPHSPQNLLRGGFGEPQVGHATASARPHSIQNFRPTSFSVPHEEQVTRGPPLKV